jgi:DNA-binding transcriptional MocR family regulator
MTGLHAVLDLHDLDDRRVTTEAFARGVEVMPLSAYRFDRRSPVTNALILGFASVPPDRLDAGMERLAAAIETVRQTRGRRTKRRHRYD